MRARAALLLAAGLVLMACGVKPPRVEPRLSVIQERVFNRYCAIPSCHSGYFAESKLSLAAGESRKSLVDVPSFQRPDLMRVAPGHPEASYLVKKLEGVEIVGEPMPNGRTPLPPELILAVREWIARGAPAN